MRKKFLLYLLLLTLAAYAASLLFGYIRVTDECERNAETLMDAQLSNALDMVNRWETNARNLRRMRDQTMLERTRAAAEVVRLNPGILRSKEEMLALCNKLGAEQMAVADARGNIIALTEERNGMNLGDHEQTMPFLRCIADPTYELVQSPQANAAEGALMQYAGVHRADAPGCVQLGFAPAVDSQAPVTEELSLAVQNFRPGPNGDLVGFRRGKALAKSSSGISLLRLMNLPEGRTTHLEHAGNAYLARTLTGGGYRLVALAAEEDVFASRGKLVLSIGITSFATSLGVMLVVLLLLHVLVVRRLRHMQAPLQRIAEGDLDERLPEEGGPEFTRLAVGINSMVDSLQITSEAARRRMESELSVARRVQQAAMPHTYPAFPGQDAFDLYALDMPAGFVSADFYDYYMTPGGRLVFMVGTVAGSGVPASLYVMQCLVVFRQHLCGPGSLQEQVEGINRDLAERGVRVSMLLGRVNPADGQLELLAAGHPGPMLAPPAEDFAPLPMPQQAELGASPENRFEIRKLTPPAGYHLLFYSDGVLHCRSPQDDEWGAEGLLGVLNSPASAAQRHEISAAPRAVQSAIRRHRAGRKPRLDTAVLAFCYRGDVRGSLVLQSTAADAAEICERLQCTMESALASPLQIEALQADVPALLKLLPPDTAIDARLICTERDTTLHLGFTHVPALPLPPLRCTRHADRPAPGGVHRLSLFYCH
ncbi:MAG: SpoIIE family protein phosphatase [Akkermansia muciniphila]|nr:SpoIIE family protein phosphatase [Akkermansia muciniphila]